LTPTNAENAHNDPKLHEGSTNDEHPLHNQRLEIDALRQEELNLQHGLDNAKASIKVLQADLEAIQAHMERQQTILEAHQGILKPGQTRLAIVQARLAVRYARLSVANNTESDMS
jgi:predicted  nucleic acid-binding Zn-ribbon protein